MPEEMVTQRMMIQKVKIYASKLLQFSYIRHELVSQQLAEYFQAYFKQKVEDIAILLILVSIIMGYLVWELALPAMKELMQD